MPPPKLLISFPCSSKWRTESSMESWQEFAPHRSATQMDLPSLSISTALVEPHVRPSGSFAQSVIVWYALGNELVGCTSPCACAVDAAKTTNTQNHMAFIFASLAWPERALILLRYSTETFVEESLDALTAICLCRVDVAL